MNRRNFLSWVGLGAPALAAAQAIKPGAKPPAEALGGSAAGFIRQSPQSIPIACEADILVVGGSTGAVAAAASAARAGAKVFLVAPHPYLGDDMTATLRLWLEKGETPASSLGKQIFNDPARDGPGPDPNRLPFTYEASLPSVGHKDTNPTSILTDGVFGNAADHSVQYNGDVEVTADLDSPQDIRQVRVVFYERCYEEGAGNFKLDSIEVAAGDDKQTWHKLAVLRNDDRRRDYATHECFGVESPVSARARYVKFSVKQARDAERILLGEIEIVGPAKQPAVAAASCPPCRPFHVKKTLDDVLLSAGVRFLYSCYATDVLRDEAGNVCGIVMANRAGRQAAIAKVVIDATDRAMVARLAGAKFRPYPAGSHILKRVVIGGQPHSGAGVSVRTIDPPFHGMGFVVPGEKKPDPQTPAPSVYPIYEYMLALPMEDGSCRSWAEAEQRARAITYDPGQQFTSDNFFEIPPDPMHGKAASSGPWRDAQNLALDAFRPAGVPRLYVLGGCADVSRAQAEKLLRPLALIDVGTRIGAAAAAESGTLPAPNNVRLPGSTVREAAIGEIRESLSGLRPVEKSPTIRQGARALPVLGWYDVVVVGGGTGGAPAGIAAARQGARTLVMEHLHALGGVGTAGAVSSYCEGNRVGFTASVMVGPKSHTWLIEQKIEWWRSKLREAGAEIWHGVISCGALLDHSRIRGVVVATEHGCGVVLAKVVIDATGNADVAAAAGAACSYTGASELAMQGTGLPPRLLGTSYCNTDFAITDETDLLDVWHVFVYAKRKYPQAFDQGQLVDTRERRAVVGDCTLTVLDEITARTYPDTVIQARGGVYDSHGYTVDPYLLVTHPQTQKLIVNIPYRCLLPKSVEGMLVTGLGISAHRDASPLFRMQADVQNGGYAAGVAAAMAAKADGSVRDIDVRALQKHLVEIGNVSKEVLTDSDSHPIPAAKIAAAVQNLATDDPAGLAVVFAQPETSLPLLRQAYRSAESASKLRYATLLAVLRDRMGVETLLDHVRSTDRWDRGWNYKGMGQYGRSVSPLDTQLVALGRAGDRAAVPAILDKLKLLSASTAFSHHRAAGLALELLRDPAAAKPLADLLNKPGMSGHSHGTIQAAIEQETPGGCNSEQTRRESLRELMLARALFRCGDYEGRGREILETYTHDLRGHLARHAWAVLKEGNGHRGV